MVGVRIHPFFTYYNCVWPKRELLHQKKIIIDASRTSGLCGCPAGAGFCFLQSLIRQLVCPQAWPAQLLRGHARRIERTETQRLRFTNHVLNAAEVPSGVNRSRTRENRAFQFLGWSQWSVRIQGALDAPLPRSSLSVADGLLSCSQPCVSEYFCY